MRAFIRNNRIYCFTCDEAYEGTECPKHTVVGFCSECRKDVTLDDYWHCTIDTGHFVYRSSVRPKYSHWEDTRPLPYNVNRGSIDWRGPVVVFRRTTRINTALITIKTIYSRIKQYVSGCFASRAGKAENRL